MGKSKLMLLHMGIKTATDANNKILLNSNIQNFVWMHSVRLSTLSFFEQKTRKMENLIECFFSLHFLHLEIAYCTMYRKAFVIMSGLVVNWKTHYVQHESKFLNIYMCALGS